MIELARQEPHILARNKTKSVKRRTLMNPIKQMSISTVAGLAAVTCVAFLPSALQAQGNSADNTQ